MLGALAAPILSKLVSGRHKKHYNVGDDPLWLQKKRGLRRLYISASLRTDILHSIHDQALVGHGGVVRLWKSLWVLLLAYMWAAAEDYVLVCPD